MAVPDWPRNPASASAAMAPAIPTPSLRAPARMAPTDAMFPTMSPWSLLFGEPPVRSPITA